jgi:hypothetical protein
LLSQLPYTETLDVILHQKNFTWSEGVEEYIAYNKKKVDCISHILRRKYLLRHGFEGKIRERIEVTGRRERRRKDTGN